MLDHVGLDVSNYEKSKGFYKRALTPLGYDLVMEPSKDAAGFGTAGKPCFWLVGGRGKSQSAHVAFMAPNRKAVDEFYKAALTAGGKDNGKPGIRKEYDPNYYAAFVYDPDGNNVEAVCHAPGR